MMKGDLEGKSLYELFPDSIHGLCIGALGLCASDRALEILDAISNEIPENHYLKKRLKISKEKLHKLKNGEMDYVDAIDKSYRNNKKSQSKIQTQENTPTISVNMTDLDLGDVQVKSQSINAFKQITQLALGGENELLLYHLADNGEPLIKINSDDAKEKVASLLANNEWKREIERLKAVAIKIREAGHPKKLEQYTNVIERKEKSIVSKIYLRGSKKTFENLPINRHHQTVSDQGEIIIYMVYLNNKWYWNPPGW